MLDDFRSYPHIKYTSSFDREFLENVRTGHYTREKSLEDSAADLKTEGMDVSHQTVWRLLTVRVLSMYRAI
jgi:hypothetical protein